MQEYRRQMERDNQRSFSGVDPSPGGDGIQAVGRSSHKMIEAVMQSTPRGKIQTIKQGYILKRSSNLRGDWKRRFFVLDSRGMLYYYRKQWGKPTDDKTIAHHTVNLLTSTIKIDAEQSDLRFCFRIISPSKTFTLQKTQLTEWTGWTRSPA
jgi:Arf-GAP/coiled-coil/ANK repeat/PH domain-containing protein